MSRTVITVLAFCLTTSGCASVGMSVLSAALGLGANHQINGISAKTFTEPQKLVEDAAVKALERMGMKIEARESTDEGRLLKAIAADRTIDVTLEAITPATTRVSAVTRRAGSIFMDGATSAEVVAQMEKSLATQTQATPAPAPATAAAPAAPRASATSGFAPPAPNGTAAGTAAGTKRAVTPKATPRTAADESSIVRWETR